MMEAIIGDTLLSEARSQTKKRAEREIVIAPPQEKELLSLQEKQNDRAAQAVTMVSKKESMFSATGRYRNPLFLIFAVMRVASEALREGLKETKGALGRLRERWEVETLQMSASYGKGETNMEKQQKYTGALMVGAMIIPQLANNLLFKTRAWDTCKSTYMLNAIPGFLGDSPKDAFDAFSKHVTTGKELGSQMITLQSNLIDKEIQKETTIFGMNSQASQSEYQNDTQKVSSEEPLFPNIEPNNKLPEKGTPTNLDRPSTMTTKITSKPTLPVPEAEPLVNYHRRIRFEPTPFTAAEKRRLNTMGGLMVKLSNDIYENRAYEQVDQLKVIEAAHQSIRKNRAEERDLIDETYRNAKVQESWSYARDLIDYFSAATGVLGGLAVTSIGLAMGNWTAIGAGCASAIGGAGNLASHILRKYEFDDRYTAPLALVSSLLSGYGMYQGSVVPGFDLQKTLAQALTTVTGIAEITAVTKNTEAQAKALGISGKLATAKFDRESDQATIKKQIGGLKQKGATDFMHATSKTLAMQDEVTRRILQETAV